MNAQRLFFLCFWMALFACAGAGGITTNDAGAEDAGETFDTAPPPARDASVEKDTGSDTGIVDPEFAEAPEITDITPNSATVGSVGPSIVVTGKNFVPRTVIQLDGAALATSFVSSSELRATIPSNKLTQTGQLVVSVGTSPPGGGASKSLSFAVENPKPILTSISNPNPPSVVIGSPQTTITVTGSNFVAGSKVSFDGLDLATTLKDSQNLDAIVPAGKFANSGTFNVVVKTPAPGGGTSQPISFTVTNPTVQLTSVTPNTVIVGAPATSISLSGTGFVAASSVSFNGTKLAQVTFVNSTTLTASIPAASLAMAGDYPIVVTNPSPGGGVSTPQLFHVNYPVPTISSLSPDNALAGAAATVVTVNGTGFFPASQVTFNNGAAATTYVSSTQVKATITAQQLASTGTIAVRIVNPTPGGGTSSAANFQVNNPVPAITSVVPASPVFVGSPDTLITVNGTGFVSTSTIRANGASLLTTFVGATQLKATVPASAFASPGTVQITVQNAAPGGGTSNASNITVGCNTTGVDVVLSQLNAPTSLATNFTAVGAPKTSRFDSAGACPSAPDPANQQPYRAVIVQNTMSASATLAAWAVCTSNASSENDAFLSFYRRATVPANDIEREVCTPVISEGIGGAGAYSSPEAGGSDWCPGLTKANGGGIALGVCEKAVVYMQPYSVTSTTFTPPTTMKISLQ
ncbi:MAG: IPT/TIG domain-containing protein [Polyangiaceae bacterium]